MPHSAIFISFLECKNISSLIVIRCQDSNPWPLGYKSFPLTNRQWLFAKLNEVFEKPRRCTNCYFFHFCLVIKSQIFAKLQDLVNDLFGTWILEVKLSAETRRRSIMRPKVLKRLSGFKNENFERESFIGGDTSEPELMTFFETFQKYSFSFYLYVILKYWILENFRFHFNKIFTCNRE